MRLTLETANDVEALVRVRDDGVAKPKCLLLHGNPGSLRDWERIVPQLVGAADVAAIDLPGFGKSPRTGPTCEFLSLDRLAEDTIAAANALGWREPIFLVGHSHGGGVALTAAARFPERVAGLILIGTLGSPVQATYRLLSLPGAAALARFAGRMFSTPRFRSLSRAILRIVLSDIFSPEPVPSERLDRDLALFSAYPHILVSMVHATLGQPSTQLFASAPAVRCPTLFVHGSEDAVIPPRCARAIHDRIVTGGGSSHFLLIPGAGHMLIEYQPTDAASAILPWLLHHKLSQDGCSSQR